MIYTYEYDTMDESQKGGGNMTLGERIIQYRVRHNISQEDFANRVQVNVMTINAVENEKRNPTKLTIGKIERVLREDENNVEG